MASASSSSYASVVGLVGITSGSKTTICRSLEHLFSSNKYNFRVKSLHMDDYFRPSDDPHHIDLDQFDHHDWDCLEAINTERFLVDLQSNRLKYDILFVEDFMIFNVSTPERQNHLFDFAYYFDLSYDPPDSEGYFAEHVWHAYVKSKQKKEAFEQNKDVELKIVDSTKELLEKIQEKIINDNINKIIFFWQEYI